MSFCKELLLFLAVYYLIPSIRGKASCQNSCKQIWFDGEPLKDLKLFAFQDNSEKSALSSVNWQWTRNLTEKWTVYYKEWPRKGMKAGGFVLTSSQLGVMGKLSWKVNNDTLIWSTVFRRPFDAVWNATVCSSSIPMRLQAQNASWVFQLGDVQMVGGKSGRQKLNATSCLLNEPDLGEPRNRATREIDGMDQKDKETVWNKVKGWFKELFDQSAEDDRGWVTRLSDWMLGFLQRVLS